MRSQRTSGNLCIGPMSWQMNRSAQISYVATMPAVIKLHLVSAWIVVAVFPFTRLVHMLALPIGYLWRSFQIVRWNRPRKSILVPGSPARPRKTASNFGK